MRNMADHIVDIVQNSLRAKAWKIEISLEENLSNDNFSLQISDNGYGMDKKTLNEATSPFFTSRTTRKVGMGLSLLKHSAELTGGFFSLASESGKGTNVKAVFKNSHIDRPPFGDISDAVYQLIMANQETEIVYNHKTPKGSFSISTSEIKEAIGNVSLQNLQISKALTDLIRNNIKSIQ